MPVRYFLQAYQNTHSLSQPHVICQQCAHAISVHCHQPLDTLQLVIEQAALEVWKQCLLQTNQWNMTTWKSSVVSFPAFYLRKCGLKLSWDSLHYKGTRFRHIKKAVLIMEMILTSCWILTCTRTRNPTIPPRWRGCMCCKVQLERQLHWWCIVNVCVLVSKLTLEYVYLSSLHLHICLIPEEVYHSAQKIFCVAHAQYPVAVGKEQINNWIQTVGRSLSRMQSWLQASQHKKIAIWSLSSSHLEFQNFKRWAGWGDI